MAKKASPTLTLTDIEWLITIMKQHFITNEKFDDYRSDVMDKLDLIIKNTTTTNEELVVTQSKVTNHTIQIKRIEDTLNLPSLA